MAGKTIFMIKLKQLTQLRKGGVALQAIAKAAAISRNLFFGNRMEKSTIGKASFTFFRTAYFTFLTNWPQQWNTRGNGHMIVIVTDSQVNRGLPVLCAFCVVEKK